MESGRPNPLHLRLLGDQLKIRHLRLLERIARLGSLTAAAEELNLTQPAVTHMLKDLESALNVKLVDRDRRGGRLTTVGQLVLDRLRISLGHFDSAVKELHVEQAQLLRVAMLPLFGMSLLPRAVAQLEARGLRLRLQIQEETATGVLQRVLDGEADCALGAIEGQTLATSADRRLRITTLHEVEMNVMCATQHPLARGRTIELPSLTELDWVLMPRGTSTRRTFDSLFLQSGLEPPQALVESTSLHTNLNLVASTRLCTFAPSLAMQTIQHSGRLRSLSIVGMAGMALSTRPLALFTHAETAPFPALIAFIDALTTTASGDSSTGQPQTHRAAN